jgi:hypothetical protein
LKFCPNPSPKPENQRSSQCQEDVAYKGSHTTTNREKTKPQAAQPCRRHVNNYNHAQPQRQT